MAMQTSSSIREKHFFLVFTFLYLQYFPYSLLFYYREAPVSNNPNVVHYLVDVMQNLAEKGPNSIKNSLMALICRKL